MSMSTIVKSKVKNALTAISKKDYEKARKAAQEALEFEPENYNANVFLGKASFELGDLEMSEQAYKTAILSHPEQLSASQGISLLYERQERWTDYDASLLRLAELFSKTKDPTRCAESLQKLLVLRRDHSDLEEVVQALRLFLPESPFYSVLSELPPPDATNPSATTTYQAQEAIHNSLPIIEEILAIYAKRESETIEGEIQKRRTRLGSAGPEAIKREVWREYLGPSKLPALYQEIINHPNTSDELRRETEAKLLQHKLQLLSALPSTEDIAPQKHALYKEVEEMVSGIVLLGIPNEPAWLFFLEGKDAVTMEDYDHKLLFQYTKLFPGTGLAKLLMAYFSYHGIQLDDTPAEEGAKSGPKAPDSEEDIAAVIMDLLPSVNNSIIGHRVVGETYEIEEDYENAIQVAENGLELLRTEEMKRGVKLESVRRAFDIILGISLVHHFPPKHHTRALRIIDDVLSHDSNNVPCLLARGCIMRDASKWDDAVIAFGKVVELLPDDLKDGLRAREERAWCLLQRQEAAEAEKELLSVLEVIDREEGRETEKARCWWRLGRSRWDLGDKDEAFKCFITSLKRSPAYAPAFTSLGNYYSDFASPPDPSRASKCFQKAFELDPREAEAARRLALGFAEEREWELVEVVARRTIEGEGGSVDGSETMPTRYQPLNAWAWKALGVVELIHQRFQQASRAFQVALRTHPEDQISWLRLGEAYSRSGRFAAAVKALEHAQELDPDDWISSYFLGEVKRQMGLFDEAIQAFTSILEGQPSELCVLASLGQTHLDFGRFQLASGFNSRAEASFVSSVLVTLEHDSPIPGFRRVTWKTAADAIFALSGLPALSDPEEVIAVIQRSLLPIAEVPHRFLTGLTGFPPVLTGDSPEAIARFILKAAMTAYSFRMTLGSLDDTSAASASYDLGMALCALAQTERDEAQCDAAHKSATSCLKEALKLDPSNERYWNALGNALFVRQPKAAQHAYIRALEVDTKNVSTWTNLGFLYLYHSDVELANEAFYKAQVLDPDYAPAWVGQGLVAISNGHDQDAFALFEHATGMPLPVAEADVAFAEKLFARLNNPQQPDEATPEAFSPAFFVLDRFCRQRLGDSNAQHLFGLVCERIGHLELAVNVIGRAVSLLEAAYEESEDPEIERQYVIAHTNMARIFLARGAYEESQASCDAALALLEGAEELDAQGVRLVIQTRVYSGLAHWQLGNFENAQQSLESALDTAKEADIFEMQRHIIVLIAQVLWATGTHEGMNTAKDRLLASIAEDPDNLTAVNVLAGMGTLTDDENLVDAALSEILGLPIDQRHSKDPSRDITYLMIQNYLAQGDVSRASSVAEKAVAIEPTAWKARHRLAALQLQKQEPVPAKALLGAFLSTTEDFAHVRECLPIVAIAESCTSPTEAHRLAEKAVMLTPWDRAAWRALAFTRSVRS